MTKLKDGQTVLLDLGNAKGVSIRSLTDIQVRVYVDCPDGDFWKPITGEVWLAARATFERDKAQLGHEHVRVGVLGADDGTDLVEVRP